MQFPLSDWCEKWYGESKWPSDGPPVNETLELRIAEVLEALRQAVATADQDGLRVEATESEWAPIETLRGEIERSLDGTPPSGTVAIARNRVPEVLNLVGAVRIQVQERLTLEAKRITDGLEGYDKPDDAEGEEWSPVTTAVQNIRDALTAPALKKSIIEEADRQLVALPGIADQARNVIKARLEKWKLEAETIEKSLKAYETLPEDAEEADWQTVKEACGTVRSGLNVPKLSTEILRVATELRDAIPSKIEAANIPIKARRDKANEFLAEVTTGALSTDPEGVIPGQKKRLGAGREDVRKKTTVKPMTPVALKAAQDARDNLEKLHADITQDLVDLGGAQGIADLQLAFGGPDSLERMKQAFGVKRIGELKAVIEDFGGKENIKTLLVTFKTPKELAAAAKNLGGPKCISTLLTDGCGGKPAEIANLLKAFGKNLGSLTGMLEKGGLKNQPKALAALFKTAAGGKATDFKAICDAFTGDEDLENFSKVLNEGGLGAKPEVLGETMANVVPGKNATQKAQGFQEWSKTMQPALGKLNTLVSEKDGLGDNPKVLAGLMKSGCQGNAAKFKALLDGLDEPALGQLNALVSKGGFGTSPNVKPECLGQLFATGCGGKPEELAKLCGQLKPADHTNLKALMGDGGLGQEPEVLAHLYKTGCPNKPEGGDWDFQKFGAAFGGKPADLKELLTTGGLGAKTGKPAVKPQTLAQLLSVGCDGDATKLKALATSPGVLPKVKDLVGTGGLGERPEVLGHAYKLGCNQDPTKLADLRDQFEGSDTPRVGRLKDLLEKANFKNRPQMLGEVLGTGCGGDAKNLKDMAVAFAGDDKMGHLKEMVDEWGPESGNAIKTLADPRHLNGDFAKLQSKFSATLRTNVPNATNRKALIKKAPQFTRKEIAVDTFNSGLKKPLAFEPTEIDPFTGTNADELMAHTCERHLPSHAAFKDPVASFSGAIKTKNTQFPPETTPDDVAAKLKAAIGSTEGKAAIQGFKLIIDTYNQNLARYNQRQTFLAWQNRNTLYQNKIAYDNWYNNQGGRLWKAYLKVGANNWTGRKPRDAGNPPCSNPGPGQFPAPGPRPPNPVGNADHPGSRPKPQTTFSHDGTSYQIGGKFNPTTGQWAIGQFHPTIEVGTPSKAEPLDKATMETLRDAITA